MSINEAPVRSSSVKARKPAQKDGEQERNGGCGKTYRKGNAASVNDARKKIAAEVVGAEDKNGIEFALFVGDRAEKMSAARDKPEQFVGFAFYKKRYRSVLPFDARVFPRNGIEDAAFLSCDSPFGYAEVRRMKGIAAEAHRRGIGRNEFRKEHYGV